MALSAGAAAGIAVACSVTSFIIASIVVFFFIRARLYALAAAQASDPQVPDDFTPKMLQHIQGTCQPGGDRNGPGCVETDRDKHIQLWHMVNQFVHNFARGTGPGRNGLSYNSDKFHQLSGGAHEDWDTLLELHPTDRGDAVVHFVCRVLHQRMVPDGDLNITLLPVDILTAYRRMLTKVPLKGWSMVEKDPDEQARDSRRLLQCWRAFTVFRSSEGYGKLRHDDAGGSRRPGCLAFGWIKPFDETHRRTMWDDDPRMPNLLAVERLLKDALAPLSGGIYRGPDQDKGIDCPAAQQALRDLLTVAADLALLVFSRMEPTELYWPAKNRRDGPMFRGGPPDSARLTCFGMRRRLPIPGCESTENGQDVRTVIDVSPFYSDSGSVIGFFDNGGAIEIKRKMDAENGRYLRIGGPETEDQAASRSAYTAIHQDFEAVRPFHTPIGVETPGWEGSNDFF